MRGRSTHVRWSREFAEPLAWRKHAKDRQAAAAAAARQRQADRQAAAARFGYTVCVPTEPGYLFVYTVLYTVYTVYIIYIYIIYNINYKIVPTEPVYII